MNIWEDTVHIAHKCFFSETRALSFQPTCVGEPQHSSPPWVSSRLWFSQEDSTRWFRRWDAQRRSGEEVLPRNSDCRFFPDFSGPFGERFFFSLKDVYRMLFEGWVLRCVSCPHVRHPGSASSQGGHTMTTKLHDLHWFTQKHVLFEIVHRHYV